MKSTGDFILGVLHFIPVSKSFNSILNEIIDSLLEIGSFSEQEEETDSFTLPELISQFRYEHTRSLQFLCRAKIIQTLIASGKVNSLKEAVELFKYALQLPPSLADFLILPENISKLVDYL